MENYQTLMSLKQIKTLMNSKLKYDLIELVTRRLRISKKEFYNAYGMSKGNDVEFYMTLLKDYVKPIDDVKDQAFKFRARKRLEEINGLIKDNKVTMYFDLGSDDCLIPSTIANHYGLDKDHAYASDITDKCKFDDNLTFVMLEVNEHSKVYNDGLLGVFDLLTAFQSLHHVVDLDFRLSEMESMAKNGCHLLIREHDANDGLVKMLIDVEHLLYEVFLESRDLNDFIINYYARYFSVDELSTILDKYGFEKRYVEYQKKKNNSTRYYYSVYVKV
jgi:hypothetical protein